MKAILAMSENRAIGKNGALPWPSIKEDFKWFKEFTMGKTIVVGRTTFEKLPPLKNRKILVVYNNLPCDVFTYYGIYRDKYEDLFLRRLNECEHTEWKDAIVAGGAKTYELFLPYITEFYVTHVNGTYEADTYMIPFEHLYNKQEVVKEFDGHRVIKYNK